MPERFAMALGLICAAAVLFGGLFARWDFTGTAIGTMAALLLGIIVGRLLGWLGAWQVADSVGREVAPKKSEAPDKEKETEA